jgi:hypothetical protein
MIFFIYNFLFCILLRDHQRLNISKTALKGTKYDHTAAKVAVSWSPITSIKVGTQQAAPPIMAGIVPIRDTNPLAPLRDNDLKPK